MDLRMSEVLDLLDISYPTGRKKVSITCPCCGPNRDHLKVDMEKGLFKCFSCGFGGGMLDLYGYYTGLDRKESIKDISKRLGRSDYSSALSYVSKPKNTEDKQPVVIEEVTELADIDTRDKVYRMLLSLLKLNAKHKNDLLARGLKEDEIKGNEYRSTPDDGHFQIAEKIISKGLSLEGVPGFYISDGKWRLVKSKQGFLIPVRDRENHIIGFQIRIDDSARLIRKKYPLDTIRVEESFNAAGKPNGYRIYKLKDGEEEYEDRFENVKYLPTKVEAIKYTDKYIWLSSKGFEGGSGPSCFVHNATLFVNDKGRIRPYLRNGALVVTEGPLKGDIFSAVTKTSTLCVAGVGNYNILKDELDLILSENKGLVKNIYLAYDMDYKSNPKVKNFMDQTYDMLTDVSKRYGISVTVLTWNEEYKGIDDYYVHAAKEKGIR